jgi:hypothetical protein
VKRVVSRRMTREQQETHRREDCGGVVIVRVTRDCKNHTGGKTLNEVVSACAYWEKRIKNGRLCEVLGEKGGKVLAERLKGVVNGKGGIKNVIQMCKRVKKEKFT